MGVFCPAIIIIIIIIIITFIYAHTDNQAKYTIYKILKMFTNYLTVIAFKKMNVEINK